MKNYSWFLLAFFTFLSASLYAEQNMWLTDGSAVRFKDTTVLKGVKTPGKGIMGDTYEGMFQSGNIPVGETSFLINSKTYPSVEAEWVLIFPEGIMGNVDHDTEVILQGMIEGKYFGAFKMNQKKWGPASLKNNLIAEGEGISTTLGDILDGNFHAEMEVSCINSKDEMETFFDDSASLKELPLIEMINKILSYTDEPLHFINLGAVGTSSALVNNKSLLKQASFKSLFSFHFFSLKKIKRKALYHLSKAIIRGKRYCSSEAEIKVWYQEDMVGEGFVEFKY